jgi:hypothetical protein
VRRVSKRPKISQEATVLRLEQLGLYGVGSHEKWLRFIHNRGNPDFSEKGGGGKEPPPQEKVKLAKYGFASPARLTTCSAKDLFPKSISTVQPA